MFHINGSIRYSDIDHQKNYIIINHEYGDYRCSSCTFSYKRSGKSISFRPAYVRYETGKIKVSFGSYVFEDFDEIHYSFAMVKLTDVTYFDNSDLFARLDIISITNIFAKVTIIGIVPDDIIEIKSDDINIGQINDVKSPEYYWDEPNNNGVPIRGYYYSINKRDNYIISLKDSFTSSNRITIDFPFSGYFYIHVRPINTSGNFSSETTTILVGYNNPPTPPFGLSVNNELNYIGTSLINIFSWIKSSNTDMDEISYELDVYKSNSNVFNGFIDNNYFITESNSVSISNFDSNFSYISFPFYSNGNYIPSGICTGNYSFRVRAKDWQAYSDWSSFCYYKLLNEYKEIFASMDVKYYYNPRFCIYGNLFIRCNSIFYGNLFIFPQLLGKMSIFFGKDYLNILAKLFIRENSYLYACMTVKNLFSLIYGSLRVTDAFMIKDLFGKIDIKELTSFDMYGKLKIEYYGLGDSYGKLFIFYEDKEDILGKVEILKLTLSGKVNIIRYENRDLYGKLTLRNYPANPVIENVDGHEWQSNSNTEFTWSTDGSGARIVRYEYMLTQEKRISSRNDNFINTVNTSVIFNLEDFMGSGIYYFYVRSIAFNDSISEVSEYILKYNKIPSIPAIEMFVNSINSLSKIPIISRSETNEFKFTRSSDDNFNDNPVYCIEVSKYDDFRSFVFYVDDIISYTSSNYVTCNIKYNDFESDYYGRYFWRVRAYDGKQYSKYGPIASFRVNTKPSVPKGLTVENLL